MVFSSMVFLWIFLPVVFVLGAIIRKPKYQNIILLIASLIFYAWGEPRYIFLLLFSIAMNYTFGLLIGEGEPLDSAGKEKSEGTGGKRSVPYVTVKRTGRERLWLILDIVLNLGLLGYFKYTNFILNTLDHLIPQISLPRADISLPIGISFFTFQAMTYVIDLYRGSYKVQRNPLNLALYISFFPQLIAGPIVKYREIDEQIMNRSMTREKVASGFRRFCYGLGKKVLIANAVAVAVDKIFALPDRQMTGALAWCGALLYTLQIYYDFSGYSDMAIGMGRMFGFEFLENFNLPYISRSISEFWRRWHISLGSWFREYLYIPLGGNRKGKLRSYVNLAIVFAVTGLWHGASWNFVGWGIYHGFFRIIERLGLEKLLKKFKVLSWFYTFVVVVVGWVFFRVESVRKGFRIVWCMFLPWLYRPVGGDRTLIMVMSPHVIFSMVCGLLGMGLIQLLFTRGRLAAVGSKWKNSIPEAIFCGFLLFYSIMQMANNAYNPFIYFRF